MKTLTIRERLIKIEIELQYLKRMITGIGILVLAQMGVTII